MKRERLSESWEKRGGSRDERKKNYVQRTVQRIRAETEKGMRVFRIKEKREGAAPEGRAITTPARGS